MKMTDVIRRPVITEKTTLLREDGRTLVFEVAPGATKIDVKRAVEKLLGSKVESVRTAISHGKVKRQGRFVGQRSDWTKAYVKLRDGENIPEFLEGA
jgi:large subunit ribosomal protein L23